MPQDVRSGRGWHWDDRGWVSIDQPSTRFQGFLVSGGIDVTAPRASIVGNVVALDRSLNNGWAIALRSADDVLIARNTLRGLSERKICDNAVRDVSGDSQDVRILQNEIRWCSSGINAFAQGGLIQGNLIHDLGYRCRGDNPDCGHFNGVQLSAGDGPRMVIDHNTILVAFPYTDAIMLANDAGAQANRTITNNLLAGGSYTLYGSGGPGGQASGIIVRGNRFSTQYFAQGGQYGPVAHWQPSGAGNVWQKNVWDNGPRADEEVVPR